MTVVLAVAAVIGTWVVGALAFLLFCVAIVALIALAAWIMSEDGMAIIGTLIVFGAFAWGVTYGAWYFGNIIMGAGQ